MRKRVNEDHFVVSYIDPSMEEADLQVKNYLSLEDQNKNKIGLIYLDDFEDNFTE
ncbi:MAG: hypothetical protein ABI045_05535 [Flavobacteriales bacterium]